MELEQPSLSRRPGTARVDARIRYEIVVGCALSALFGIYDFGRVRNAPWLGIPRIRLPGLDLKPGAEFWALLPVFVIVSLVAGIKNIGDGVVIQQESRRRPGATDFQTGSRGPQHERAGRRRIRHCGYSIYNGLFMSSAALVNLTGVASRTVGYFIGMILLSPAFLHPLGHRGKPTDIAAAVAFLAGKDASFVTSHTLVVDGGLASQPRTPT